MAQQKQDDSNVQVFEIIAPPLINRPFSINEKMMIMMTMAMIVPGYCSEKLMRHKPWI